MAPAVVWEKQMPPNLPRRGKAMATGVGTLGQFLRETIRRYIHDRCLEFAASLTFTTLLAFVPMMAIALAILAHFPVFDDIRVNMQAFVLDSFLPDAGLALIDHFGHFVENTAKLSAVGAIGLAIAVFMLLLSIESAFNAIWHVTVPRPFMWRVLAFWTVLTLGPILLGISVTLSGYLYATAQSAGVEAWTGPGGRSTKLLPPFLEFAAFSLLYGAMPNRPVKLSHALTGALVATVLFEGLKKGFGVYVTYAPTYQTIYGAMAAVPITLIWVYLAWCIGLFGAVLSASLSEWRVHQEISGVPQVGPGMRLTIALSVLSQLRAASVHGEVVPRKGLLRDVDVGAFVVETVLGQLLAARYVTQVGRDGWVLARDLDDTTLYDLYEDLRLGVSADALRWMPASPWSEKASESIGSLVTFGRDCMAVRLKELFAEGDKHEGQVVRLKRR